MDSSDPKSRKVKKRGRKRKRKQQLVHQNEQKNVGGDPSSSSSVGPLLANSSRCDDKEISALTGSSSIGSKRACREESNSTQSIDEKKKKQKKRGRQRNSIASSSLTTNHGQDPTPSLASRLKKERGTAASTPLPPEWKGCNSLGKKFLTPDDGGAFGSCLKECYRGFYWENPNDLPSNLHSSFTEAFHALDHAGLFLHDAVQPGGKKLSLTFVTRTVLGCPGATYRYLGLRLFSHPWCDVDERGDMLNPDNLAGTVSHGTTSGLTLIKLGYSPSCTAGIMKMGQINKSLISRTNKVLKEQIADTVPGGLVGSANYSLTLVNKMEPTSVKRDLKAETLFGLGKTSVSWHKDSGLQDFSSIAVYHSLEDDHQIVEERNWQAKNIPWRVALRVASEGTRTPALSVPLPSGSLYYLLDDFNHKHEHAVLAGSNQLRYSSTHRVAREGQGTWAYIRDKCEAFFASSHTISDPEKLKACSTVVKRKQFAKEARAQQLLMTEIEFEWLRQWHIQGKRHADLHPYWHQPIKKMISFFEQLEKLSVLTITLLEEASHSDKSPSRVVAVSEDLFDVMIETIKERMRLRAAWEERQRDPIFDTLPREMRPVTCPSLDRKSILPSCHMPEDLGKLIEELRSWRNSFVNETHVFSITEKNGKGVKRTEKCGNLTKKEQKKVASNWEKMKSILAKKTR